MTEIEARQEVLTAIYEGVFGDRCPGGKTVEDMPFEPAAMTPDLEARLSAVFEADPEFEARYKTPAPIGERSDREFYLCARLYAAGFNEQEIYTLMTASPQQKWHERGDDYRIRTIRHAIEAEKSGLNEARKILEGLKVRVEADISAINRHEALRALAVLKLYAPHRIWDCY
jgi:hypothetical protein